MKKVMMGLLVAGAVNALAQAPAPTPLPQSAQQPAKPMTLFKRAEYVPAANLGMMTEHQRAKAADLSPGRNNTKAMTLVRMNKAALYGKQITLEMPDGKNYTFFGALAKNTSSPCWSGKTRRNDGFASICIDVGGHVDGEIDVAAKQFHLTDISEDVQILREFDRPQPTRVNPSITRAAEVEDEPVVAIVDTKPNPLTMSNGTGTARSNGAKFTTYKVAVRRYQQM